MRPRPQQSRMARRIGRQGVREAAVSLVSVVGARPADNSVSASGLSCGGVTYVHDRPMALLPSLEFRVREVFLQYGYGAFFAIIAVHKLSGTCGSKYFGVFQSFSHVSNLLCGMTSYLV